VLKYVDSFIDTWMPLSFTEPPNLPQQSQIIRPPLEHKVPPRKQADRIASKPAELPQRKALEGSRLTANIIVERIIIG
jgi:hypothetical protein